MDALHLSSFKHVLEGVSLGEYAIKKVAVGDNRPWLQRMLLEVTLLETLRHPNIIEYKHSWLETNSLSKFGRSINFFIMSVCICPLSTNPGIIMMLRSKGPMLIYLDGMKYFDISLWNYLYQTNLRIVLNIFSFCNRNEPMEGILRNICKMRQ